MVSTDTGQVSYLFDNVIKTLLAYQCLLKPDLPQDCGQYLLGNGEFSGFFFYLLPTQ